MLMDMCRSSTGEAMTGSAPGKRGLLEGSTRTPTSTHAGDATPVARRLCIQGGATGTPQHTDCAGDSPLRPHGGDERVQRDGKCPLGTAPLGVRRPELVNHDGGQGAGEGNQGPRLGGRHAQAPLHPAP